MSNDGLYKVQFYAAGASGMGVIYVRGNRVRGGDFSYLYTGELESQGSSVTGVLQIKRHSDGVSVFGPLDQFGLYVVGDIQKGVVFLRGHVEGRTALQIRIEGQRIFEEPE